jgi:hypothetical protein
MQQRNVARELGLVVASVGVMVHWLDTAPAALVTALLVVTAAAGTGPLVGEWRPWRWALVPMVLPALAALAIAGIARVVGPVPWLFLVFAGGWAAAAGVVYLETAPDALLSPKPGPAPAAGIGAVAAAVATTPPTVRLRPKRRAEFDLPQIVADPVVVTTPELPPHPHPLAVRLAALGLGFLAFVASGGLVPGGLALDRQPLTTTHLVEFVAINAAIAGLVGYRLAALASPHRFDRIVRLVAAGEYAVPVALSTTVLRSLELPRLFVPALLTLVVYLVTGIRESPEPVVQNPRLLQEVAVLSIAALAAIAWGLMTR